MVKIDTGGTFVRTIGPGTSKGVDLNTPETIAVDSATGKVYVGDASRIWIYDANGVPLGDLPGGGATGIVVSGGDVYIGEMGFSGTGQLVRYQGDKPTVKNSAGGFTGSIAEIAADSEGRIYVADSATGVVDRFEPDLSSGVIIGSQGLDQGQTNIPAAVALDCRANLYVVDQGQRTDDNQPASKALKFTQSGSAPPPCADRPPPPGALDLQINDMDVFQATQFERTYTAGPKPPPGPPLFDIPELEPRSRAYGAGEVALHEGHQTVVRVYANERLGPPGGIGNIPMTLTATTADGRTLGPIQPVGKPAILVPGDRTVDPAERSNPAGAYSFVLPSDWTKAGTITLTARLNPAGIGCDGPCINRTTFQLTGVTFNRTISPKVIPISLTTNGKPPVKDPQPVFNAAHVVTPVNLKVQGWGASVAVDDLANQTSIKVEDCFLGIDLGIFCSDDTYSPSQPEFREYLEGELMDRLEDAADDADIDNCDEIPLGLLHDTSGALAGLMRGQYENKGFFSCALGYAEVTRPLTSVAHELAHAFARPHASTACGASGDQEGEDWPPDQRGDLNGIGLDPRTGSGGSGGAFRVIYPNAGGGPGEVYDMMSYCADESDAWVSPRGWNAVIGFRASELRAPARPQARKPKAARDLHVTAIDSSTGTLAITGVSPADSPANPDPSSVYTIEARDAAGNLLASAYASSAVQLNDGGGTLIDGSVPAPAGTTQVLVWRGTEAGTRRQASASPPKVKLKAPRGGTNVAGANLTVRWAANDPDGPEAGPVEATVSYAADGKHFTAVQTGPADAGVARIPRSMLAGSKKARVRVDVDDGFHVDSATSKPFAVKPSAPDVQISDPAGPVTIAADAPLNLSGAAFGPGGDELRAKALRWTDRKDDLGKGGSVTVSGLKPGKHKLTLSATSGGRTGRASVQVTVTAVGPQFLQLSADPISAKAKKVKLHVASTVAAKLRVGKQTFNVSPKPAKFKVKVPRGKASFALPVTLKAGRLTTPGSVVVQRG